METKEVVVPTDGTKKQNVKSQKKRRRTLSTSSKASVDLKFDAKFITKSLRGQNYDLETALSELIDNSIDADSTEIKISIPSKKDKDKLITITDNGKGMTFDELRESMTLGSDRMYDMNDIGHYGIGMKSSIAYLSEKVEIRTKKRGDRFYSILEWDIDNNPMKFNIKKETSTNVKEGGTSIIMKPGYRFNFYGHTQHSQVIKKFSGRYHHLLSESLDNIDKYKRQATVSINDTIIKPSDPMYRKRDKTLFNVQPEIEWKDNNGNSYPIKIRGYYLKNYMFSDLNKYDISTSSGKLSINNSGVYVMVNNRYINLGGTFLGVAGLDPHVTYLRIELEVPKHAMEYLNISMNKNNIGDVLGKDKHTDGIKDSIRMSIKELISWGRAQEKLWRQRNKPETTDEEKSELDEINKNLNNDLKGKGITKNAFDDKDIRDKISDKSKNNRDKKSKSDKDGKHSGKERSSGLNYNKDLVKIEYVNYGENNQFWNLSRDNKKIVIELNRDHTFYKEFINTEDLSEVKKMYKLLYSIANAQLETYRLYDFGGKIHNMWDDFWDYTSKGIKRTLED